MSRTMAPWLQGLEEDEDDAWDVVVPTTAITQSGAAASKTRCPSVHKTSSRTSIRKSRDPLAELKDSGNNSLRRLSYATKTSASRSFSAASDRSILQQGTVQQRSKSTSPVKQRTLEWKRRLMGGQIAYGDQTDLFGPSGLENIFAPSRPTESTASKARSSIKWDAKSAVPTVPVSASTWPPRASPARSTSSEGNSAQKEDNRPVALEEEEKSEAQTLSNGEDSSFRSNPFDLHHSRESCTGKYEQHSEKNSPESGPIHFASQSSPDNFASNRTISGQTDLDEFSPVFISKHTSVTGHVEYKALDSRTIKQFNTLTVSLKHPSQGSTPTNLSPSLSQRRDSTVDLSFTDGPENVSLPALPDLSLSENLPTGTPPASTLGNNVQLARGGYSDNGSFRNRLLSASQSIVEPSTLHESHASLSPRATAARVYPTASKPGSSPIQHEATPRSRSSKSPLKLFGFHDTFTSNHLRRRMSQLEDPDLSATRSEENELSGIQQCNDAKCSFPTAVSRGSFGKGDFDNHSFDAEITVTSASNSEEADSDRSPNSAIPPPGSRSPVEFRSEDNVMAHDTFKLKRKFSKRSDPPSKASTANASPWHLPPTSKDTSIGASKRGIDGGQLSQSFAAVGSSKRVPHSPFKVPTPKRRRTLHASEMENESSEINHSYHTLLQEAITRQKRKDSRRGHYETADAAVLAQRKILRPRNPTPSQARQDQITAEIKETTERFAVEDPEGLEAVLDQIESSMASDTPPTMQQQANAVAHEVAKFSLRIHKASGDHTERKPSVTTQDFFNEAVMVMRLIREKAGRQSGLGSVAESDHDASAFDLDHSEQELSSLSGSRPPSREGGSGWRPRTSQQNDARVISHLRKYQERDETEYIAPSIASLEVDDRPEYVAVDEQSNIRIKGPLPTPGLHVQTHANRPSTQDSGQTSVSSSSTQGSEGDSTGRTLLSRKSENVGCLGMDAVAHLIGEQVGAMTYDKGKQQWIKVKGPRKKQSESFVETPSNITSDDDPFREISDLPVDEHKEEEIRKASCTRQPLGTQTPEFSCMEESLPVTRQGAAVSRVPSQGTVLARPSTADSKTSRHTHSSSHPSHSTALASSEHQTVETRATSWGHEDLEALPTQNKMERDPLCVDQYKAHNDHVEQESEGERECHSSSAASISHKPAPSGSLESSSNILHQKTLLSPALGEDTAVDDGRPNVEELISPKLRQTPRSPFAPSSVLREGTEKVSLRRKALTSKLTRADLMEESELSFVAPLPGERMMSVSLSISRPISKHQPVGQVLYSQASPTKYDQTLLFSDLPEFTVHEEDFERPSERALARRLAQHAAVEVDDRYALLVKDLVKTLTDVKADEPYWDDLQQLDLHDQGLASIHGLKDFCSRLQDIDVSVNQLTYLNGMPSTVRQLVVRQNQLTSLTPWTHLMNLQYLDISGNQLDNLDGLSCLVHLRELCADDNRLSCIQGIMRLDGLLKLRARRNNLTSVDFRTARLHRLQILDLSANCIAKLSGLELLPGLELLNLDSNVLRNLPQLQEGMPRLKTLSLQDCALRQLSVTGMPSLQTLHLDGNALSTVVGIEQLSSLNLLSMRKQSLPRGDRVTILENVLHARVIRLSGNDMRAVHLPSSLLSLQHLELASVGLQELPEDFGLLLPNLVSLNLNFNSLADVRPLLNIQKLAHVSLCGNRIDRLRKNVAALSRMTTLKSIDLRDNPLTQGCYASSHACRSLPTSLVRRARPEHAVEGADAEDETVERLRAAQYALPDGDQQQDLAHHARLDEATKLRRRVYHLLLGNGCPALCQLDGLPFDKRAAARRDRTWERLVDLGIARKSGAMGMKQDDVSD